MSLTVTSFCGSIQARFAPLTYHIGVIRTGASSALGRLAAFALIPRLSSAARAASSPVTKAPWVDSVPAAAPATDRLAISPEPGTKAAISSRHTGRERWCEVMLTLGFHPPDTPSALALITSVAPLAWRTVMDDRPSRPALSITSAPRRWRMPGSKSPPSRLSITATTSTPLACKSSAVRNPSSLLVKIAVRSPTATPQRLA